MENKKTVHDINIEMLAQLVGEFNLATRKAARENLSIHIDNTLTHLQYFPKTKTDLAVERKHELLKERSLAGLHNVLARHEGCNPYHFRGIHKDILVWSIIQIEYGTKIAGDIMSINPHYKQG